MTAATTAAARGRMHAVVRTALALMFSTVATATLGLVFWVVGARVLDAGTLGRGSAAVSAVALVAGLSSLSFNAFIVRYVPTAGAATGRMLGAIYGVTGSVAVILAVIFCLSGLGRAFLPTSPLSLLTFCAVAMCFAFLAVQDSVLTALRRTTWIPVLNTTVATAKVLLIPAALGGVLLPPLLLAWSAPVAVAVIGMGFVIFWRLVPEHARRTRNRQDVPSARATTSFVAGSLTSGTLSSFMLYAPPVMVSLVLGAEQTAYFTVPWLATTAAMAVTWNIAVSFMVEASTEPARMREHRRHAVRLLLLVNVGGGLLLIAAAPLVLAVLGAQYTDQGTATLRLLGLSFAVQTMSVLFHVVAVLESRVWRIFVVTLIEALLFLGGGYLGLREYGIVGLAAAYLVANAVGGLAVILPTVSGLRRLLARSEPTDEPGRASPRALGVASVPQVYPDSATGHSGVVLVPEWVIDWDRLGRMETVLIDRLDDGTQRLRDDRTLPLHLPLDFPSRPPPHPPSQRTADPSTDSTEPTERIGPPAGHQRQS